MSAIEWRWNVGWGLKKMEVTFEDQETGETVRLQQGPDGKVSCEEKAGKPKTKPANTEQKTEKPAGKPRAETKTGAAKPTPAAKAASKKAEKSSPAGAKAPPRRKATSLVWAPCVDHGFPGFKAPSAGGQFKLLKAKNRQWALFYEQKGTDARKAGCFGKEAQAKVKAQALHDEGWPANESDGNVTAADLAGACPIDQDEEEPEMKTEKKTETKSPKPEPEPAPAPASKPEAEQDKELVGSFTSELDSVLDEDEDD